MVLIGDLAGYDFEVILRFSAVLHETLDFLLHFLAFLELVAVGLSHDSSQRLQLFEPLLALQILLSKRLLEFVHGHEDGSVQVLEVLQKLQNLVLSQLLLQLRFFLACVVLLQLGFLLQLPVLIHCFAQIVIKSLEFHFQFF